MKIKCLSMLFSIALVSGCSYEKIEPSGPGGGGVSYPNFEQHFSLGANTNVQVLSVVPAIDSGYIISGYLTYTNFSSTGVFVCKTSPEGGVEQTITNFGFNGSSTGGKLIRTSDNNYLLVATGGLSGDSDDNLVLIKLKPDLTTAWKKSYGATTMVERGTALCEMEDGNYLAAGSVESGSEENPYVLKVRSDNGAKIDDNTIDFPNFGRFRPVTLVRNGSSYGMVGYNYGVSVLFPFFVKVNSGLDATVQKDLGNVGNGDGELAAGSADGFVLADGFVAQTGANAYVLNINGSGDPSGEFDLFSTATYSGLFGLAKTTAGGYAVAGWALFPSAANNVAVAALITGSFATQHTYQYAIESDYSEFKASAPVSDGGFVFAGHFGQKEVLLVKLNKGLKLN